MPDPRRPGQARLASALAAAAAPDISEAPWVRGTVAQVLTGPPRVRVTVTGLGTLRCPYLAHYSPSNGDTVWLSRIASGSYLCHGRVAT